MPFVSIAAAVIVTGTAVPVGIAVAQAASKEAKPAESGDSRRTAVAGDYLVIDLSGGPSASNYPVGYLSAVPSGGWSDEYKTTKLVMSNRPSFFTNSVYYLTRPVEQVSYYDVRENADSNSAISTSWPASGAVGATSFMGKLRAKTGLTTFDLPTEAQWEYACRAGTANALNSGYNLTDKYSDARMAAVGRYLCGDYSPDCAPSSGTATVGSDRVPRGGSFYGFGAQYCRSAARANVFPADLRPPSAGFRAAMALP